MSPFSTIVLFAANYIRPSNLRTVFLLLIFAFHSPAFANSFSSIETILDQSKSTLHSETAIAFNQKGKGVFAWSETIASVDNGVTKNFDQIFVNFMKLDGSFDGPSIEISTPDIDVRQNAAKVGIDEQGNIVVVWKKQLTNGKATIVFRQFDKNGLPLSEEQLVESDDTTQEVESDLAVLSNGDFIIAWSGNLQLIDKNAHIYMRQFSADGSPKTLPVTVSTMPSAKQALPRISVNSQGDFAIAWERWNLFDGWDVAFRTYDASGSYITPERIVEGGLYRKTNERHPSISLNEDQFVLAFECRCNTVRSEIFMQRFDIHGNTLSGLFQPPIPPKSNQLYPNVVLTNDKEISVSWINKNNLQNANALYAQHFSFNNTPDEDLVTLSEFERGAEIDSFSMSIDKNGIHHTLWSVSNNNQDSRRIHYSNAYATLAFDDRSVNPAVEKVYLAGVSYLADIESWKWQQVSGTFVELSASDQDIVTFAPPENDTTLRFQVTAENIRGFKTQDVVTIRVAEDAGIFHDNELIELDETYPFIDIRFISIYEINDFTDGGIVESVFLDSVFGKDFQLNNVEYPYTPGSSRQGFQMPQYVSGNSTNILKMHAVGIGGKVYEKLQIIKVINKPYIVPKPDFPTIKEWPLFVVLFPSLISFKDPSDGIESCDWEQIEGYSIYFPESNNGLIIDEEFIDHGGAMEYSFSARLSGGIPYDLSIKMRRTCQLKDGTEQIDDFDVELLNTPYTFPQHGFTVAVDEGDNFKFDLVPLANIQTKECEITQESGPALISTVDWNVFTVPAVDQDSFVEVNVTCHSHEDEIAEKNISFTIVDKPDLDIAEVFQ
ncbi:hypothetical protein TDB9533_00799 [Thalassocella blandensis]|nr:hypothetical protein TDB9533_00799 [Thalassocella blandensis]